MCSGVIAVNMGMLMLCYRTYTSDVTLKQRLFDLAWSASGWTSFGIDHMSIWLPESLATFAILLDPELLRVSREDYIL
jgi:hypothetical protein